MLNKKGQGLTEYGIILLLILLVGGFVWFNTDIKDSSSSMYSTISSKLKSIIGLQENNYDTDNKYIGTWDPTKVLNRASPTYLTTLKLANGMTILWRKEGGKYDKATQKWTEDPDYKIYTVDKGNFENGGTWGLMINSYGKKTNGKYTYTEGMYASAGYTYDANTNCTTTYFQGSDNQIYLIRDYGNMGV